MKHLIKTMAFTLLGLVLSSNVMADTAKIIFSSGTSSGSDYYFQANSGYISNILSFSSAKNSSSNDPAYNSGSSELRLYYNSGGSGGSITITAAEGVTFSGFVLNTNSTPTTKYTADNGTATTVTYSNKVATVTNLDCSSIKIQNCNTSNTQLKISSIEITYSAAQTKPVAPSITTQPEGASYEKDATATALTVAASGNPTPTYQWYSNTTESTSGASAIANATNASYTPSMATIGTKYYYCVATNSEGSATSNIVAVTVTAALPKITITADQVTSFTNSYKEYTWTASDVSGKLFAYKQNGMQFNTNKDGYYVYNTDPIPGNIRSIKMTTHNSGTERDWDVWVSAEPITEEEGVEVQLDKKNVAKAGTTWEVSGSYQYFYLQDNNGASNISEIVITYEELAPTNEAITFAAPEGGSLFIKNGATPIATGAAIQDGTILDVTFGMTPAEAYKDVAIKVTKTDGGDDVTSTVYNGTKKQITMPRYAITVAVTFTKLYKISLTKDGDGTGTATINGSTETIYVGEDDEITLVAEEGTGSEFGGWTATDNIVIDKEGDAETFAYAGSAGTITATFNKKQCTILNTPQNIQVTDKTYSGAKLTWDAVANADFYEVYITKGAEEIESDIVEETEYTILATLSANTEYSYSVVAGSYDEYTYCASNPAEGNFTTADYPAATLTLSENGDTRDVTGLKVNTPFNLPDCEVFCDKVFVGWSESNTDHSNLLAAGSPYTMNETTGTLYAWFATETTGEVTDVYTLAIAQSSSNTNYAQTYEITVSDINWKVPGNQGTGDCVKLGGKLSSATDRALYSKTAISSKVDKVIANHGTKDAEITVNSIKLDVYSTAALAETSGNGDISSISGTYTENGNTEFLRPSDANWTGRFYRLTYNLSSSQSGSNKGLILKTVTMQSAGASSYSDYSTTCSAKAKAPEFDLAEDTYTETKTLTITAEEGAEIYYTLDGTEPDNTKTPYEGAIQLNTYGKVTVKAIAYVAEKGPSDVTSAEYMMDLPFTSLQQLAETEVASGSTITISFPKTAIKSIAGTHGVYFDIQKEGKDIEIYCKDKAIDDTWEAGGNLSAENLTCKWVRYPETGNLTCWELTPSDWSAFEYSDPDPYTSVADLYAAGLVDGAKVYLNIANAYVHAKTYTSPNNFVYVQDGGVGIVLRTSETIADENIGKLMTAKIVGKLAYSNGRPQIAVTSLTDVSYTAGSRPAAVATTLSEGEEASQILSLVKIDGYYAQSQDKQAKTAVITEMADGTGASYTIYNLFGALKNIPESDKAINVKGLFYKKIENNVTSYSIVPVLVEDVALVTPTAAPAATISKGSTDQANPSKVGNGEKITITPAAGFTASYILNDADEKTITATTENITMTADATLILNSSRDYYTTTTNTYYYELDESLTYHSITKPIGNYTCELSAPSAKLNDEVTITFAMNDHWYLDGVTVKNAANETETFEATKVSDNKYSFAMPAYDVKLSTATHSDPTYEITYLKNGKQTTPTTEITESKQFAGTVLTLKECNWTASGVEYDGWKAYYVDEQNDNVEVELPITDNTITVPAHNVRIYAQWVNTYTVTFTKGSASSATGTVPTETPKRAGAKVTLPQNPFSLTGYTFVGWKANTDDEIYQPSEEYIMTESNVKFDAQWDVATYLKDGKWELVTKESDIVADAYYVMAENVAGNVASYEFSGNNGKQYMQKLTVDEWTEKTILTKDQIPDKTAILKLTGTTGNWIFTCENNQKQMTIANTSDAGLSWTDAGTPLNIVKKVNGENNEMNIYVMHNETEFHMLVNGSGGYKPYSSSAMAWPQLYRFYPKAWTVTFDDNVVDEEIEVPEMQRADPTTNKVTISTDVPVRTGYDFSIWNSAKGGTGVISAEPGDEITLSQNTTLYAQWNIKQYNVAVAEVENVTINAKPYGEADITEGTNADVNFKKSVVLTYSELNEDYVFKSWKVTKADDALVEVPISVGSSTTFEVPAYAVTVSAVIESKATTQLTVTYHANGGKNKTAGDPEEVSEQVYWNTTIKFSEHPCPFEKNLCTFAGWNTKADGTGTTYKTQVTVKSDIDLYAMWEASGVQYKVETANSVKVQEGAIPEQSTATFENTYTNTATQLTADNSMTLTLSGYDGKVITGISLSTRSNSSKGSGTYQVEIGDKTIFTVTGSYKDIWGDWSTSFETQEMTISPTLVKDGENIVITISATENSLHCQSFTIFYTDPEIIRNELAVDQYTTFCWPKTIPANAYTGATFWNIEDKTTMADGRLSSITIVLHEGDLEAGVPYIMYNEATELKVYQTGDAVEEPAPENAANGLVGVFTATMFDDVFGTVADDAAAADRGIYIISDGTLYLCGNYCGVYANRAYILNSAIEDQSAQTPPAAPRRVIGRPNVAPTILENVFGNQPAGKAQKVFIDGQIYIIRDTKVFNAQGQLAK